MKKKVSFDLYKFNIIQIKFIIFTTLKNIYYYYYSKNYLLRWQFYNFMHLQQFITSKKLYNILFTSNILCSS